jgi:arylsulfatase A-like enzyme
MNQATNVLFLVIDSGRHDRIGPNAFPPNPMPYLSKIMSRGAIFQNAFANSNTTQFAMPSLFSSTLPLDHGGYDKGVLFRPHTLPECLKGAGYDTVAFSNTPPISRANGYARGTDQFFHYSDIGLILKVFFATEIRAPDNNYRPTQRTFEEIKERLKSIVPEFLINLLDNIEDRKTYKDFALPANGKYWKEFLNLYESEISNTLFQFSKSPDDFLNRLYRAHDKRGLFWRNTDDHVAMPRCASAHTLASGFLGWHARRKNKDVPFWAYLHFMEPHERSLTTTDQYVGSTEALDEIEEREIYRISAQKLLDKYAGVSSYDLSLRMLDIKIKNLIGYLEENKILKNTLVVVTADHGSKYSGPPKRNSRIDIPDMYNELLHIPLAFVHPDIEPRMHDIVCSQVGIAPSILNLLGISSPDSFKGRNLFGDSKKLSRVAVSENTGRGICDPQNKYHYISMRSSKWKAVIRCAPPGTKHENILTAFYDVTRDPLDKNNLKGKIEMPEEVMKLTHLAVNRSKSVRSG